jgi:hypothetical protein
MCLWLRGFRKMGENWLGDLRVFMVMSLPRLGQ